MSEHVEALGPFRFTATLLVYDSGHEFRMVPYDQIASAEIETAGADDPATSSSARAKAATTSGTAPGFKEFSTRRTSWLRSAPPPTWTTRPPSPQCPPWSPPCPLCPRGLTFGATADPSRHHDPLQEQVHQAQHDCAHKRCQESAHLKSRRQQAEASSSISPLITNQNKPRSPASGEK